MVYWPSESVSRHASADGPTLAGNGVTGPAVRDPAGDGTHVGGMNIRGETEEESKRKGEVSEVEVFS